MNSNISLSPHFELKEFTASATAREHGIDNTPPPEAVENLRALCVHTLEPLREALGLPVIISSGYRTKALNHLLVCHSNKSQHMEGCAADFYVGQPQVSGSKFQVPSETDGPGSKKLVQSSRFQVQGGTDGPGSKNLVQGSKFKVQEFKDSGSKNLVSENEKSEVGGLKAEDTTFNSQFSILWNLKRHARGSSEPSVSSSWTRTLTTTS